MMNKPPDPVKRKQFINDVDSLNETMVDETLTLIISLELFIMYFI